MSEEPTPTEAPEAPKPSDKPEKDYSNEIWVRRKLIWAMKRAAIILAIACPIWILLSLREHEYIIMRNVLWCVIILPGFLSLAYFLTWKCPRCDAFLGRSSKATKCRRCGLELPESKL